MAVDALKWAAYTYIIAAVGSLATLLYYVAIAMGARRTEPGFKYHEKFMEIHAVGRTAGSCFVHPGISRRKDA